MPKTTIEVEILEDGTISITTGDIADTAHVQADELLKEIEEALGGEVVKKTNPENPGKVFFNNKRVIRGGKVVKA